jgi:nucleotide-binding universal stress UspA family protein
MSAIEFDATGGSVVEAAGPTAATGPAIGPVRIAVLLAEADTVAAGLSAATAVSVGGPAEIRAVRVGFEPGRSAVSQEEIDIQYLREVREGPVADRMARTRREFDTWLLRTPSAPPIAWRIAEGDVGAAVVGEAAAADLLVIGRPVHLDARDALRSALFRTRRLVLVAPPERRGRASIGRDVVIGWKPTENARHAVAAAAGWLKRAERITVLCVAKAGVPPYEPSVRTLLGELGITAEVTTIARDGRSVGRRLLDEVDRIGADSLLIGAYHHGPLWEAILGGVTRDVLTHMNVPVFMMR